MLHDLIRSEADNKKAFREVMHSQNELSAQKMANALASTRTWDMLDEVKQKNGKQVVTPDSMKWYYRKGVGLGLPFNS